MTKDVYFLIRYDWKTKRCSFAQYDDQKACQELMKNITFEENVYRCGVKLTLMPDAHIVKDQTYVATELVNETDKIDWDKITAFDAITRIKTYTVFPIIPNKQNIPLMSHFDTIDKPKDKKQIETVTFGGRKFRITVEEVE